MEDVFTWSVKLQTWASGKISLRAFIPIFAKALECILQLVMSAGATSH